MGNLNIHFQGLGLWVDAGDTWRVLMPRAELFKNDDRQPIERHDPRLLVGAPRDEAKPFEELTDCELIIDTASVRKVPGASVRHANMLGIRVHEGSAAAHPTPLHHPVDEIRERVSAQLTLPPGRISAPNGTLFRQCEFHGRKNLDLTFRPLWSAPMTGDSVRVEIRPRGGGASRFITYRSDSDGDVTLWVQHISKTDRERPDRGRTEDKDFVANYGLSRAPGMDVTGPHPRHPRQPQQPTDRGKSIVNTEYHLCSPAFASDDPNAP